MRQAIAKRDSNSVHQKLGFKQTHDFKKSMPEFRKL